LIKISDHSLAGLRSLCRLYNVDKLYLFGSALSNDFNKQSDIDLVVKFKSMDLFLYFDNYIGLKEALEHLLNRKVDLLEEQAIKNPILLKAINSTKELIYG